MTKLARVGYKRNTKGKLWLEHDEKRWVRDLDVWGRTWKNDWRTKKKERWSERCVKKG